MAEPLAKKARVHPNGENGAHSEVNFLTLGESMLRFQPIDEKPATCAIRHLPQPFLRSIGGDELNVAVAMSLQGVKSRWVSVVPAGPLGDIITKSCAHHGVEFLGPRPEGDLGTYTVLPELRSVHYQRKHSAFAQQDPNSLDWTQIFQLAGPKTWLHVTGITPLVSPAAYQSWDHAVKKATSLGIPVSLDLNHRKQLGTLEDLWGKISPHCASFEVVILSLEQLNDLAVLQLPSHVELTVDSDDASCFAVMSQLHARWKCKRVALCRKIRDSAGIQRRWSLLTALANNGEEAPKMKQYSSHDQPVWHIPKDECGGGSAWAAGLIHALHLAPVSEMHDALRRADLLSAMTQETEGDFTRVTAEELAAAEKRFAGEVARLPGTDMQNALHSTLPSPAAANQALQSTLSLLKGSGVLAILRAKGSPDVAVKRGIELASMGCTAMEVTMDSTDWQAVLKGLRQQLPKHVALGVGTVMDDTVNQVGLAKSLGATFALSPIDPIGFVEECHRHGILAIPSAFTSNECWALHRRGVHLIKLFHAGLASPAILKSMLGVSPLGANLNILPSGGVSPSNAFQWLDAGAAVVGMGSNLVGKDIETKPGSTDHAAAVLEWETSGQPAAAKLFKQVSSRFAQK